MAKEKIIDNLCSLAINRYRKDNPGAKVTKEIKDAIYVCVSGVFTRSGEVAAYKFVKTTKLLG